MSQKKVAVIIVTHNSAEVLPRCLAALEAQTLQPLQIVIVDSGSTSTEYLAPVNGKGVIQVFLAENKGFGCANNRGYQALDPDTDYILFLNPDAFAEPESIARAVHALEAQQDIGCAGARLLGFNCQEERPTGLLDSTGVFRRWYGCWYDRGQGRPVNAHYNRQEDVPAVCGAFLFCRMAMLRQVDLGRGEIFDPDFFLYKEDIELCLRIRARQWRIVYFPDIVSYHCRGWQQRKSISHAQRCMASSSELLLYKKHPSPYFLWALLKYTLVRWGRI